mmetsp:Transcript_15459/g.39962  ORF Transcript_15459/g.39962 Transcript_15459/m.39962 type:complete len:87 (+) Transcript_15459:1716-1976(+)
MFLKCCYQQGDVATGGDKSLKMSPHRAEYLMRIFGTAEGKLVFHDDPEWFITHHDGQPYFQEKMSSLHIMILDLSILNSLQHSHQS